MSSNRLRVLYIEDEADNRESLEMILEEHWNIDTVAHPKTAVEKNSDVYDGILLDLVFSQGKTPQEKLLEDPNASTGIAALEWIKKTDPEKPVFILSALPKDTYYPLFCKQYKNIWYIEKPVAFDQEFRVQIEQIILERKL